MTDLFIRIYNSIGTQNSTILRIPIFSVLRYLIRLSANILVPLYFRFTSNSTKHKLSQNKGAEPRLIITLTSFPKRINRLWIVLETLLRQTHKPDLIILWLSKEQFPTKNNLPQKLLHLEKRGVRIELKEGDLRSYKKIIYALQEFPNDILVTVDDDIFYSKRLIESLYKKHLKHPKDIICNYAYELQYDNNSSLTSYSLWKLIQTETNPSSIYFFGSGGGTLFPPNSLHPDVINANLFLELCPNADDIWLNTMARLNNRKIAKVELYSTVLPVLNKNDDFLATLNLNDGQNDIQLQMVKKYFFYKLSIDPYDKQINSIKK